MLPAAGNIRDLWQQFQDFWLEGQMQYTLAYMSYISLDKQQTPDINANGIESHRINCLVLHCVYLQL